MRYRNQSYPNTRMVIDGDIEVSGSIVSQELTEALGKAQTAVAQTRNLQQAADISLASIADAASDDVITPLEKLMLKREMANVESEYPVILLQTASSGIEVDDPLYLEFVYRYNRLREYLYGDIFDDPPETVATPVLALARMGDNYAVEGCGGELRQRFQDYVDAREGIRKALTDAAHETKTDLEEFKTTVQIEISARAKFYYGGSTPVGPYSVGDVWVAEETIYMATTARGTGESDPDDWEWYIRPNLVVIVESTNGDVFKPGQNMVTQLIARAFKNGIEVTATIPESRFRWRRVSYYPLSPPYDDGTWDSNHASGYKMVEVTAQDVESRATYFCDILE